VEEGIGNVPGFRLGQIPFEAIQVVLDTGNSLKIVEDGYLVWVHQVRKGWSMVAGCLAAVLIDDRSDSWTGADPQSASWTNQTWIGLWRGHFSLGWRV